MSSARPSPAWSSWSCSLSSARSSGNKGLEGKTAFLSRNFSQFSITDFNHSLVITPNFDTFCQKLKLTTTQPMLGWHENDFTQPPPPPTTVNSMSAISQLLLAQYWWNFKGSFLGALEQIPTIKLTFVQATFVLATFVHIKNISAVTVLILMKL